VNDSIVNPNLESIVAERERLDRKIKAAVNGVVVAVLRADANLLPPSVLKARSELTLECAAIVQPRG
jgi:hypothetical protein